MPLLPNTYSRSFTEEEEEEDDVDDGISTNNGDESLFTGTPCRLAVGSTDPLLLVLLPSSEE